PQGGRAGAEVNGGLVPLPDRAALLEGVLLSGVSNNNTRRAYIRALEKFMSWYSSHARGEISREGMLEYRTWLEDSGGAAASINQELSALRRMMRNAARAGFVDPHKAHDATEVANARSPSIRAGNWLTAEQAKALLFAPAETTLKGKRDRAILGALIGCG